MDGCTQIPKNLGYDFWPFADQIRRLVLDNERKRVRRKTAGTKSPRNLRPSINLREICASS
jgi:hypothetical protein